MERTDIPVFIFTGFLDSGKTTFIQGSLEDERFNNGVPTLLVVCEEGEEDYDFSAFSSANFPMNRLKNYADAWNPETGKGSAPIWNTNDSNINASSDRFLISKTYFNLRNITLGYRVNQKFVRRIGLSAIDVNFSVNNVCAFSNMRQMLNYDNTWFASFPTARSYVLGLTLTF